MGEGKRGRDSHGRVMEICSLLSRHMFCLVHRVQELLVSMVSVDMALPMTQNLTCVYCQRTTWSLSWLFLPWNATEHNSKDLEVKYSSSVV